MIEVSLLNDLKSRGEIYSFPAGKSLLSVGATLESFVFVLEGELKIFLSGPDGKRKTLYWIKKQECCLLGVNCLLNSVQYPASAVTTQESKVLMLPKNEFTKLMDMPSFRDLIFSMQSQRLSETLDLLLQTTFRDLDFRVANYLVKKSHLDQEINITHLEVSEDLGASRERVSKSFKKMEVEGLIEPLEKGFYRIISNKIKEKFEM